MTKVHKSGVMRKDGVLKIVSSCKSEAESESTHDVESLCRVTVPEIVLLVHHVVGLHTERKSFIDLVSSSQVEVIDVLHLHVLTHEVTPPIPSEIVVHVETELVTHLK